MARRAFLTRYSLILVAAFFLAGQAVQARDYGGVCAHGGTVVTASPPATAVGVEILKRGGNAVDAAVAVGFALAVTYTLNDSFGSKVVVRGAGFLLNNEMDDFSIKPGHPNRYGLVGSEANAIEPGKRMLSSMAPTMVLRDGKLFLVLGTPGGATIITTIAQIMIDMLDFNMSLDAAVSATRR